MIIPVYTAYDGAINYVRISETPEDRRPALLRWLVGLVIPFVPGLNPMDAIYLDDYQRFLAGRPALDGGAAMSITILGLLIVLVVVIAITVADRFGRLP